MVTGTDLWDKAFQALNPDIQKHLNQTSWLEYIARMMVRYRVSEDLYLRGSNSEIELSLEDALNRLYAEILTRLSRAIEFLVRVLKSPFRTIDKERAKALHDREVEVDKFKDLAVTDTLRSLEKSFKRVNRKQRASSGTNESPSVSGGGGGGGFRVNVGTSVADQASAATKDLDDLGTNTTMREGMLVSFDVYNMTFAAKGVTATIDPFSSRPEGAEENVPIHPDGEAEDEIVNLGREHVEHLIRSDPYGGLLHLFRIVTEVLDLPEPHNPFQLLK
ncbi:hypothetical protein LZ31DRAFT_598926 [Colletotrichum somersetense]|nr:hypothetical protein LZ31DRAFT_598926 [Colletotrichum somersetense]